MTKKPAFSPRLLQRFPNAALRAKSLGEFVGQKRACENMRVFVNAGRNLNELRAKAGRDIVILTELGRTAT